MEAEKILEVKGLSTSFRTERGVVKAIDGVSFHIRRGEILGMVGESGCGKSVTSQSILRLYDEKYQVKYGGEILFAGKDLLRLPEKEMQKVRGNDVAMVFQDALSSLNPVFTVGHQIMDTLRIHQGMKKAQAREKAVEMLRLVGIPSPEKRVDQYPHELSGGMRQRVALIRTLATGPDILLLDEAFSALDYQTRLNVTDDVYRILKREQVTTLMVTHDIPESISMGDKILVLSARPAQVKEILSVDFGPGRSPLSCRANRQFGPYFDHIWKELSTDEKS